MLSPSSTWGFFLSPIRQTHAFPPLARSVYPSNSLLGVDGRDFFLKKNLVIISPEMARESPRLHPGGRLDDNLGYSTWGVSGAVSSLLIKSWLEERCVRVMSRERPGYGIRSD